MCCVVQKHGAFTLVLSGGSLLKALGKLVGISGVDYSKWHIFYADERNVPHDSEDSTHRGAQEAFLSKVGACSFLYLLDWLLHIPMLCYVACAGGSYLLLLLLDSSFAVAGYSRSYADAMLRVGMRG